MKRLIPFLFAAALASPALAQHAGHVAPAPTPAASSAPVAACTPEHAAMGHCKLPAPAPVPVQTCSPEHAAMGHCRMPPPAPAPAVAPATAPTCAPEHAAMGHCKIPAAPTPAPADPHAGHVMPPASTPPANDPHAGHDMGGMPAPPVAPPPPGALSGPAHAADTAYDPNVMAQARNAMHKEHGSMRTYKVMLDQFEARIRNGRDGYALEGEAWYGGDINKLWLKTEVEGEFGRNPEQAEVQALYSRAIDPWWNLQAGVRYDFRPDPERAHLVLGIEGLAPYWFEIDAAAFLSDKGEVTARLEVEYDQRLTQKLILQPRVEFDLAAQNVPEIGLGSGLSNAEAGLRLRYEIVPEFAPYVGVAYERAFGNTADFRRAAGEEAGGWSLLVGVRAWF